MKDRISTPPSGAGLTRYFEDSNSKIKIKPAIVILGSIIVITLVILLHLFGNGLLK
jgi:preprotein translocase subunit Sec61beta